MRRGLSLGKYFGLWILALALAIVDASTTAYLQDLLGAQSENTFSLSPYLTEQASWYISIEIYRKLALLLIVFLVAFQITQSTALRILSVVILLSVWILGNYFWLYFWTGWPPSPMSYGVIYFVPYYWVSPVLCPLLLASTGIVLGSVLIYLTESRIAPAPTVLHWIPIAAGFGTCLYALMGASTYYEAGGLPPHFPWMEFWSGYLLIVAPTLHFIFILTRKNRARFR